MVNDRRRSRCRHGVGSAKEIEVTEKSENVFVCRKKIVYNSRSTIGVREKERGGLLVFVCFDRYIVSCSTLIPIY